jgi:UDP-glucose 4-epimerase
MLAKEPNLSTLRTVLITGAAGRIGSFLTRHLEDSVASSDATDELRFGIFHGLSNNRWNRLDISETRSALGYAPQDDTFVLAGILPPH